MKSGLYYIEVEHIPEAEAAGLLPTPEMQGPEKFIVLTDERMFFGTLRPVECNGLDLNLQGLGPVTGVPLCECKEPVQLGDYLFINDEEKGRINLIYNPKEKEAQPNE